VDDTVVERGELLQVVRRVGHEGAQRVAEDLGEGQRRRPPRSARLEGRDAREAGAVQGAVVAAVELLDPVARLGRVDAETVAELGDPRVVGVAAAVYCVEEIVDLVRVSLIGSFEDLGLYLRFNVFTVN